MSSDTLASALEGAIPSDHSRQFSAEAYARAVLSGHASKQGAGKILDVGCGTGDSVELFRELGGAIDWTGVDIEESPEVRLRVRTDARFVSFDGVRLPFAEGEFDVIFSRQVFEHVRYPAALLAEIRRVLKPGGVFIGSTSQLEPYHSFSLHNHTPYGFKLLLEEAGMRLSEVRPGIDGFTLIARRLLRRPKFFDRWWQTESPLNRLLSWAGRLRGKGHREINEMKLLYCGHFSFLATKDGGPA